MLVKFNSLDRLEKPSFTLCNPGSTYSNGTISRVVGALFDTTDEEFVFNFNATSELNIVAHKILRDDADENAHVKTLFSKIENRRMIFVDGIGYFIITNVTKNTVGDVETKNIQASSCEIELQRKQVSYIEDNTYNFVDLLEKIVAIVPKWTIGTIDSRVAARARTFSDIGIDKNVLAFMIDDMQDAYECIFIFDIINRQINVYDQSNYVSKTDIHITNQDVINSLEIEENSDDIYTAINVFGDNDLNIVGVNPLGSNVIYDFSYYLDWMSDGLRSKVESWSTLVESSFDEYYNLNLEYYDMLTEKTSLEFDLDQCKIVLDLYKKCRDNIIADGNTSKVGSYNATASQYSGTEISISDDIEATLLEIDALIEEYEAKYSSLENSIAQLDIDLESKNEDIVKIRENVSIQDYFTPEEYDELSDYISEGTYNDEFITTTDSMTYSEVFTQMKTLYDRALSTLKKLSVPMQKFSVDTENFLFVKEFKQWSDQLETGCLINVELEENDVAELFLSTITFNLYDRRLDLTFGNRYNKFDPKSLFDDVLGDVQSSANSIEYIKDALYPITSGEFNSFRETLANSRTLAKDAALSSVNQDVVIDDTGYTGREVLDDGSFDPRQIKITGRTIVFTDDSWQTAKVAIGEIVFDEDTKVYGINAEAIIGELILGGNLQIKNSDGTDLLTAVDNKISANMSNAVTPENFGDELRKFNSTIEADSEAVRQHYKFHSELGDSVSEISAYIHTGLVAYDENDNPIYGVKVGQESSEDDDSFSSIFTSEEVAFYDTGEKLAYLSNKKMNVSTARTTGIELSNNLDDAASNDWKISIDNGFSIKWVGSTS